MTGYDIDPARLRQASEAGVKPAASPARVAEAAEVILSSLTDPAAVRTPTWARTAPCPP